MAAWMLALNCLCKKSFCSLCQSVDGKLKAMLEDNQLYVQPSEDTSKEPSAAGPFDRYSDAQDVLRFCQDASASCIQQYV